MGDYVRFAGAFIGFLVAAGGVMVSSVHLAVLGTAVLLLALVTYALPDVRC